jgi:hypothetical protein
MGIERAESADRFEQVEGAMSTNAKGGRRVRRLAAISVLVMVASLIGATAYAGDVAHGCCKGQARGEAVVNPESSAKPCAPGERSADMGACGRSGTQAGSGEARCPMAGDKRCCISRGWGSSVRGSAACCPMMGKEFRHARDSKYRSGRMAWSENRSRGARMHGGLPGRMSECKRMAGKRCGWHRSSGASL